MKLAICIGALAAAIALICISLRTAVADPKMQLLSLLMGRSSSSKRPRHKHVRA